MELWNGFRLENMEFEGKEALVVFPAEGTACGKLAVKTEYFGAFPEAAELPLLEKGFHLCYIKNNNRWGTDEDLDRKARFIRHVQKTYGLDDRCVPVGMSCGGLFAIKLAAKYPELIACLYLDAPVLNYMSCPCGFGTGIPLNEDNSEILEALQLTMSELICYRQMPMDKLDILVKNRIPVVMVYGDSDRTVPYHENGILLERAYAGTGIDFEVYSKSGCDHHPHGLEDPILAVDFILRHC